MSPEQQVINGVESPEAKKPEKLASLISEGGRAEKHLKGIKKFAESKTRGVDYEEGNFVWAKKGESGRWSLGTEGRKMAAMEVLGIFGSEEVMETTKLEDVRNSVDKRLGEINRNIEANGNEEEKAYWRLVANSVSRRAKKMEKMMMLDVAAPKNSKLGGFIEEVEGEVGKVAVERWALQLMKIHQIRRNNATGIKDADYRLGYELYMDDYVTNTLRDFWYPKEKVLIGNEEERRNFRRNGDLVYESLDLKYPGVKIRLDKEEEELNRGSNGDLAKSCKERKREVWMRHLLANFDGDVSRIVRESFIETRTNRDEEVKSKHLSWRERAKVAAVATVAELTAVGLIYLVTSL